MATILSCRIPKAEKKTILHHILSPLYPRINEMSIKPAGISHQDFVLIAPNAAKPHFKAPTPLTAPANTSTN
jgi:hypothetical protein